MKLKLTYIKNNMKNKILLLPLISFLCFSCKKDYTCECTSLYGTSTYIIHNTKKKAQKECNEKATYNNPDNTNCKIK